MLTVAVLGIGVTAFALQNGNTGLLNFASSRNGSNITIRGTFPNKVDSCRGDSPASKCVYVRDGGDNKVYQVLFFNLDEQKYFGKKVKIEGKIVGDTQAVTKIFLTKITIVGDGGGGGGGQNQGELKLKVVPTLASDLGKINLAVSWNEALLSDSHLTDFRLNVRPAGGNWMVTPDSMGKVATKNLSDLAVTNGETYQVKLTMALDDGQTKEETQEVSYVEDQFESFNSKLWQKFCKNGQITVSGGVLTLSAKGSDLGKGLCNLRLIGSVDSDFEAEVGFVNYSYGKTSGDQNTLQELNFTDARDPYGDLYELGKHLAYTIIDNYAVENNVNSYFSGDAKKIDDFSENTQLFKPANVKDGVLKLTRKGNNYKFYGRGKTAEEWVYVGEKKTTAFDGQFFLSEQSHPMKLLPVHFDNFRLVWVK